MLLNGFLQHIYVLLFCSCFGCRFLGQIGNTKVMFTPDLVFIISGFTWSNSSGQFLTMQDTSNCI